MPLKGNLATIALLASAGMLFAAGSSRAEGNNSIGLTGTVPTRCDLAVKPRDAASSLGFASRSSIDVATVREVCQNRSGYTIKLFTKNGARSGAENGVLASDEGQGGVPYTVTYGGAPVRFVDGAAVVQIAHGKTGLGGIDRILSVSVNGTPNRADAAYTDILVIAITGN